MTTKASATAPGKLVLFGEYAVLENHPALVASSDRFAVCNVEKSRKFTVESGRFGTFDANNLDQAPPLLRHIVSPYLKENIRIEIDTTSLFGAVGGKCIKLGLGSSAAVTVSTLKCLALFFDRPITSELIFSTAQTVHHTVQGLGSGVDIAAASFGGVFQYRLFDNPPKEHSAAEAIVPLENGAAGICHLTATSQSVLLGVHLGQAAATPAHVKAVRQFKELHPSRYARLVSELGEISSEAINAWSSNDVDQLHTCCRRNNKVLRELGERSQIEIIPPKLEALNRELVAFDAVAKTTGAGGGDMAWVPCKSALHAREIDRALQTRWPVYQMKISERL